MPVTRPAPGRAARPTSQPALTPDARPRWLRARVAGARQLGPTLRRVTLAGEDLMTYARLGPDEYFGLLIPAPGHGVPPLTGLTDPRAAVAAVPPARRPHLRWYTVRHHRPEFGEVDVDMVTHGDNGRASAWAASARPGDPVGFFEGAALYAPPAAAATQLLVGDETALPAIGAILESAPTAKDVRAFIEVPTPDDVQELATSATVTFVARFDAPPGRALLNAVRSAGGDGTPDYAWVCAEAGTVARTRSYLLRRGVARDRITYSGYWNRDRPRP